MPPARPCRRTVWTRFRRYFVIDKDGKVIHGEVGFQTGLDFMLAQELGIKNYNPMAGATDDSGSH